MEDYYQLLGVSDSSSFEEIKKRFHYLALVYHPDRFPDIKLKTQAEEGFKKISVAYQVLSDLHKRAEYDRTRVSNLSHFGKQSTSTKPTSRTSRSYSQEKSTQHNKETVKQSKQKNIRPKILIAVLFVIFCFCVELISGTSLFRNLYLSSIATPVPAEIIWNLESYKSELENVSKLVTMGVWITSDASLQDYFHIAVNGALAK